MRAGGLLAGSLAIGLAVSPRAAAAQEKPSLPLTAPDGLADAAAATQECCLLLLLPIGARQTAMGMAATPLSSPEAVFYNPAGLAELDGWHFTLHHVESSFQPYDAFSLLFSPGNLAVFGVSYGLIDYGVTDLTQDGEVVVGRVSSTDHLLIASFATMVLPGVSTGVSYKYYNFRNDCSGECGGQSNVGGVSHMLDVGLQYEPHWIDNARFGLALLSAGTSMQVVNANQATPPPTRLRLGVSYDVLQLIDSIGPYALTILVEAQEDDWKRPTSPQTAVGFEASVSDFVFLRGGYGVSDEDGLDGGPAVGLGIVYSHFNVAVAKRVDSGVDGDQPFQLTIDVGF